MEGQFVEQLRAIELDSHTQEKLREVLKDVHRFEEDHRKTELESLRRRYDEVQKRRSVLLDAYLDKVVGEDDYRQKAAALVSEQAMLQTDLRALEATQDSVFELIEAMVELAGRLSEVFEKGDADRKRAVVSVVALNASLKRQKARLNLFPPVEVLQKAKGVHDGGPWWTRTPTSPSGISSGYSLLGLS